MAKPLQEHLSFEARVLFMLGLGIFALGTVLCLPFWPQDPCYHSFADHRTLLGVPNLLNVLSNTPFVVIGVLGWLCVLRSKAVQPGGAFLTPAERWPFVVLFTGIVLTGFGSGYYHLEPTNDRLVWDRLPMTVGFMSFFAAMIGERINIRAGVALLLPFVALGIGSVVNWHRGEQHGAGNLWVYGFVQFYPLVAIPLMIGLFPPRYSDTGYIWCALGWYGLAKLLELGPLDRGIYELGHIVSGHTLKHLAAAVGAGWIARMVQVRAPIA